MRSRLSGLAVAAALGASACGSGGTDIAAPPLDPEPPAVVDSELASARDTLPPAPATSAALTVVLTHPDGAASAGLDAAASALAQRPDIEVVVAVAEGTGDATMSGFDIDVTAPSAAEAVAAAVADRSAELVVVGIVDGHGAGTPAPAVVDGAGEVATLVVGAGPLPDHAAATMQLLEVLDLELDRLLDGAAVHRLAVPSCQGGMLRGRLATRPGPLATVWQPDCTSTVDPADEEADAFAHGYATLTRLP